jgi:hypothetical protein
VPQVPALEVVQVSALVRCQSHRARERLFRLVGEENCEGVFSMFRNTNYGAYRIPAEQASAAKALSGVSGMREGDDLMRTVKW